MLKKTRQLFGVMLFLFLSVISGRAGTMDNPTHDTNQDRARPEPVLFLELAAGAMKEYYRAHNEYPQEWYQLDFTFANGPYRVDDPDVRATLSNGNKWKPRGCAYAYLIKYAGKRSFLIQAIDSKSFVSCQIVNGMIAPALNIAEEGLFHEYYKPVMRAVVDELKNDSEDPTEFYAEIEPKDKIQLVIHLMHQGSFLEENVSTIGNPGGKCRDFYYDLQQHKITRKLFWK